MTALQRPRTVVMPGLDPGVHSVTLRTLTTATERIAGSSPAITAEGREQRACPSPLWGGVGEGPLRATLRLTPPPNPPPQGGRALARFA
jgi:hypothetical protein